MSDSRPEPRPVGEAPFVAPPAAVVAALAVVAVALAVAAVEPAAWAGEGLVDGAADVAAVVVEGAVAWLLAELVRPGTADGGMLDDAGGGGVTTWAARLGGEGAGAGGAAVPMLLVVVGWAAGVVEGLAAPGFDGAAGLAVAEVVFAAGVVDE